MISYPITDRVNDPMIDVITYPINDQPTYPMIDPSVYLITYPSNYPISYLMNCLVKDLTTFHHGKCFSTAGTQIPPWHILSVTSFGGAPEHSI